jgi:RNA polymerase sigma factor (sigma-70 family)
MDWETTYWRLTSDREDAPAWAALEQRVRLWAHGSLRGVGGDLIDDAVADTCAGVAISLERAHGADTFAGFVYGHFLTVRRRALRTHLRRTTASREPFDMAAPDDEPSLTEEQVHKLHAALAELPDREHRAVVLRYLESATPAQIAAELNVTPVNARQLVYRGLCRLRHGLRDRRRTGQPASALGHAGMVQAG